MLQLSIPKLWMTLCSRISMTWNGNCACAVSRDLHRGERAKVNHIFEIPGPKLSTHFVTFRLLRQRLSCVIGEK